MHRQVQEPWTGKGRQHLAAAREEDYVVSEQGFAAWLRGYASYVNMVHPEEGAEGQRSICQFLM